MDIRNICLLGHGGSGKTSLVESMLYLTGVTDRLGKPADGNTVCDYDPEEIKRQISISLAMTPVMYNGVKINVMDTPGNFDFAGEMQSGVRAAEVGVLVCASKDGLSVGAERCWKYLKSQNKPCIVYISKEDEENANFSTTLEALREPASQIVDAVHNVLERTPPELAADIYDRGIVLTGGGSLISGLDALIEEKTGINTMIAEEPLTAVAIGTGKFIEFAQQ